MGLHCVLGISQDGVCQALGLCCLKSSPETSLLTVPGNLVEKQNPRSALYPCARSISMVTCVHPLLEPHQVGAHQ